MMKFITTIAFAIVFTVVSTLGIHAQSAQEFLEQAREQQSETCQVNQDTIQGLFRALSGGLELRSQSEVLSFLATQYGWRSVNHPAALRVLTSISNDSDIRTETLVARAHQMADEELVSILTESQGYDEAEERLQNLLEANLERNYVYSLFIRTALAQLFQERGLTQLEHNIDDENVPDYLAKSVAQYEQLQTELIELQSSEGFGTRDFRFDVPYQLALIKFFARDPTWPETLEAIISESLVWDEYNTSDPNVHILIERFVSAPALTPPKASSTNCSDRSTIISQSRDGFGRDQVQKFYNSTQLVNFTCNALSSENNWTSPTEIVNQLETFENHDYRVVLGHYRGDEVRFSFKTRTELLDDATAAAAVVSYPLEILPNNVFDSECAPFGHVPRLRSAEMVGEQATGNGEGYVFWGSGLTYREAGNLLLLIKEETEFRDAYIIRPNID
ncbi:MAG: hypothetical protein ABJO27_00265 [Pseudoruegeria sp.]